MTVFSSFQCATLLKKRFQQRPFFVNFAKFLRTSFDRTPPDGFFLSLSVNFKKFSKHLFYRAPLRNCLLYVQVAEFQQVDTVKNYFIVAFQAVYTRARSSHSKAFLYLTSFKIICEEVNSE